MAKNARFWIEHKGSHVKLTLSPGENVSTEVFEYTDEGWSRDVVDYEYHTGEDVIRSSGCCDSKDCDGRLTQYFDSVWPVSGKTSAAIVDWDSENNAICDETVQLPQWGKERRSQRDFAAESSGY